MPHILIVEDETIIRSALRRLLERNQYEVSEAGSVQEAQERFSIPSFDLIVSDLRLPRSTTSPNPSTTMKCSKPWRVFCAITSKPNTHPPLLP